MSSWCRFAMSALGHKRTWQHRPRNVRFTPKADMVQHNRDVRFAPKADIAIFFLLGAS